MLYKLLVDTNPDENLVTLRLTDAHGTQLGHHQIKLADTRLRFLWEGLFDLSRHVDCYAARRVRLRRDNITTGGKSAEEMFERLSLFVGQMLLGPTMMNALTSSHARRTLLVQLPETENDPLAAAFAQVPWEIARSAEGEAQPDPTVTALAERLSDGQERCGCS